MKDRRRRIIPWPWIIWVVFLISLVGMMRWAGSDVCHGRTCLSALSAPLERFISLSHWIHRTSSLVLEVQSSVFLVLPIFILPVCRRRHPLREGAKTWALLCACASCYAAESTYLQDRVWPLIEFATGSFVLAMLFGHLSAGEKRPSQRDMPWVHHLLLAVMLLLAALFMFYRVDRLGAQIFHGFAPWWTMKVSDGIRIPGFWEGIGVVDFYTGSCIASYRSPVYLGLSWLTSFLSGSFLICSRLASGLFALSIPLSLYGLCGRIGHRNAGLMAAGISLLWPLYLIYGRYDNTMVVVLSVFLLASWLLMRSGLSCHPWTTFFAGALLALCAYPGYLYSPARLIPPAAAGFFLWGLYRSPCSLKLRLIVPVFLGLSVLAVLSLNPLTIQTLFFQYTYDGGTSVAVPQDIPARWQPLARFYYSVFHPTWIYNFKIIGDFFFSYKPSLIHHLWITPLMVPAIGLLLGRGLMGSGLFLLPWLVVGLLPGLASGPHVYPSRIAILDGIPMLAGGLILGEISLRISNKRQRLAGILMALVLALFLGCWSVGWYFDSPEPNAESQHIGRLMDAATLEFNHHDQGLVVIEPLDPIDIERLSLLYRDQTGRSSSSGSVRFLTYWKDRDKLSQVAQATCGQDRGWVFLPESWRGLTENRLLSEKDLYGFTNNTMGFDFLQAPEKRVHPSVAFKEEPVLAYSDLEEVLSALQGLGQPVHAILCRRLDTEGVINKLEGTYEDLGHPLYLRVHLPPVRTQEGLHP